jgi:hypothetical protein
MRKLKKNTQSAKVKCIQMQPEMFELLVGGGGREEQKGCTTFIAFINI